MSLMWVCSAMQMSSPWRVSNWKMCSTPATRILKKTAWLDEPNCATDRPVCQKAVPELAANHDGTIEESQMH